MMAEARLAALELGGGKHFVYRNSIHILKV